MRCEHILKGKPAVHRAPSFKQRARPLIEKIGIEIVGFEQRDTAPPRPRAPPARPQAPGSIGRSLVEVLLGDPAMLAGIGGHTEIANQWRRNDVKRKRIEEPAKPTIREQYRQL